jgi:HlyD family secretion protein
LLALSVIVVLVGVLGSLAATIRLNGAVIATGTLVVDSYVKPVQHQKGGTVDHVFVRNGDRVEAGQVLVHLDDTQARATLAIVSRRLRQLAARTARLSAERDGLGPSNFPLWWYAEQPMSGPTLVEGNADCLPTADLRRRASEAQLKRAHAPARAAGPWV